MTCVVRRWGSGPGFLWLWSRLAAVALIQSLALELPYAIGVAGATIERKKKEEEKTIECKCKDVFVDSVLFH